jgi:hypothetical protein
LLISSESADDFYAVLAIGAPKLSHPCCTEAEDFKTVLGAPKLKILNPSLVHQR